MFLKNIIVFKYLLNILQYIHLSRVFFLMDQHLDRHYLMLTAPKRVLKL